MEKSDIVRIAGVFAEISPLSRVGATAALRPDLVGMRMYETPLIGIAAADDPEFDALLRPEVIGPHFRLPKQWLANAMSVISFFLPLTDQVVESNQLDPRMPSDEWMHARIEGQEYINALSMHLVGQLEAVGYQAIAPALHPDFKAWNMPGPDGIAFSSNWSERHIAHVAGLGTFGLSSGLITARGMAGRFGSIITSLALPADSRLYHGHDDYCTYCGVCARRCLAGSISSEAGRDKIPCADFLGMVLHAHKPHYGCGKCQVAVPCARGIPMRKR